MKKQIKINLTVRTIPHPNPKEAIDLIAGIVVKQISETKKAG